MTAREGEEEKCKGEDLHTKSKQMAKEIQCEFMNIKCGGKILYGK